MANSLVQRTTGNQFTSNTIAGSTLVLVANVIGSGVATPPTIGTPSTSGFTWSLAATQRFEYIAGSGASRTYSQGAVAIYYIALAASMSSSVTTSVSFANGSGNFWMYEFSGPGPIDTTATNSWGSDNNSTITAGTITLNNADFVLIAQVNYDGYTPSAASGFTTGAEGDQYILNAAVGSLNTAFATSVPLWACVAAAFIPASSSVTITGVTSKFTEHNPSTQTTSNANVSISGVVTQFTLNNPTSAGQQGATVNVTAVASFFEVNLPGVVSENGATITVTGLAAFFYQNGGTAFVRVDTVTVEPFTALYQNQILPENIGEGAYNSEGRTAVILDFYDGDGLYSRDIEAMISWPVGSQRVIRSWQPSLIQMPETVFDRPGDWIDGGSSGAKYIQGIIVEADSLSNPKTFSLQASDDLSIHPLLECPATFEKQTAKAFSCIPFIAHSVRRVSTDGIEWRVWKEQIVFQPYPELTMNWTCPPTSLGLVGWGHIREMNVAHISTANLVLSLSFDAWPLIQIPIVASGGLIQKIKITIPANKWKVVQFSVASSAPFRLFQPDLEVKVGVWGRSDPYQIVRPFGGQNSPGAEV